ncbi:TM1812 family CRISPR-associated protein [Intestinibacter sp.]
MANKLILFLSDYRDQKETEYISEMFEEKIKGTQTSDAPTRYFLKYLAKNNEELDSILCITSKKANEKAYEKYKEMVENELGKSDLIKKIEYDYEEIGDKIIDKEDIDKELLEGIVEQISEGDTIYIDYTSGMRDITLLIILIIRYIEYKGAKCGGMIYSYYNKFEQSKNKIVDIKSTYDLFNLLNAINEFTSFGKISSLYTYYEKLWEGKEEDYKEIKNLLDSMKNFSDMISLCIVDEMDEAIEQLRKSIKEIRYNINDKDEKYLENKLMVYMLFNLIGEIEEKFNLTPEKNLKTDENKTYLGIIKWCLKNDLIQQALTLYVEKMPKYYFDYGFIDINDNSLQNTLRNLSIPQNDYAQVFYRGLFKNIEFYYKYKNVKNVIKDNSPKICHNKYEFLKDYDEYIVYAVENIDNISIQRDKIELEREIVFDNRGYNIPADKGKFISWVVQSNKRIASLLRYPKGNEYREKIDTLTVLSKENKPKWFKSSKEDLVVFMQDYLLFKIMRNQINHANKSELCNSVKTYFNQIEYDKDIRYNTEIKTDSIKKIMLKSIDRIENIINKFVLSEEYASREVAVVL